MGDDPGQLKKKSGRVGTWGVLTNIYFYLFSFNAVASVDHIYLLAGRVRPGMGVLVKANLIFFASGAVGGGGGVGGSRQFFL